MEPAVAEIIRGRIKPILDEVFDGFIVMGYHTGSDGVRRRLVLQDNGVRQDGSSRDAAITDGLSAPLELARTWGRAGS